MKKHLFLLLFAAGLSNAQVFSENFNTGTMPSGWTASNPDTSANWGVGMENGFAMFPTGAAFFDDDDAGSASINTNARLTSPVISLAGTASPKLSFKYANMIYNDDSTLKVEVFNGTSWVQVFTFSGDAGDWGLDFDTFMYTVDAYAEASNIDLTPYINPNFQLRFVYDDAGDYSYGVVIDDVVISSGVLSTSETLSQDMFEVYPNPVRDNFYIKSGLKSQSVISVMDSSGKLVKTFSGKSDAYNLSDLPKGTYMLIINNGKSTVTKKIIKQ